MLNVITANKTPSLVAWVSAELKIWQYIKRDKSVPLTHFFFPLAAPVLTLMPTRTVSPQCVFLPYRRWGNCFPRLEPRVWLRWVDEAGAEIQDDSQHQLQWRSSCDITLTVAFQSPGNKKFRCQATVGDQVYTSVVWQVRAPGLFMTDPNQETIIR